jgi:hypothetical protein
MSRRFFTSSHSHTRQFLWPLLAAILLSSAISRVANSADNSQDDWQFEITPYFWLPTISGTLNYEPPPDGSGNGLVVEVGPTDWLDLINGVAMVNGGMKRGRFSLSSDFIYLALESEHDIVTGTGTDGNLPIDASLNVATQTSFDGIAWTLLGGYTLSDTDRSSVDIIGGVRYFGVDVRSTWNLAVDITGPSGGLELPAQGSRMVEVDLWDGIVGMRGKFKLGEGAWSVPFYFDVGAGSSELTWQAMTGLSYRYAWGDLIMVYRHLSYDEGASGFIQNLSLTGPTVGARFRF